MLGRGHLELEQQQLALEVLAAGHVLDLHDVDELAELADDLRITASVPVVTSVSRETVGSSVGATDSDSML